MDRPPTLKIREPSFGYTDDAAGIRAKWCGRAIRVVAVWDTGSSFRESPMWEGQSQRHELTEQNQKTGRDAAILR
jgi:hypothetical protein